MGALPCPTVAAHSDAGKVARVLLDYWSKLPYQEGPWSLKWSPAAGEASITHGPAGGGTRTGTCASKSASDGAARVVTNARRAAGELRRYSVGNRLNLLWTLTYREWPADWATVRRHLGRFWEDVRTEYGRLPYVSVIERGTGGTRRLHAHFGVVHYLNRPLIEEIWGHGAVQLGDPGKMKHRSGQRGLARYLGKYVAKQFEEEAKGGGDRPPRAHRYERSQGFNPPQLTRRYGSFELAQQELERLAGSPVAEVPFGQAVEGPIYGVWYRLPEARRWPAPEA